MLLSKARLVPEGDVAEFAWSGLRVFRNIEHTQKVIIDLHSLDRKQHSNARKQAKQIRHCLIQAEEYARAAEVVTSATRPTLQYYSVMSLATAETLLKGTGEVSLDFARAQHDHHGLSLSVGAAGGGMPPARALIAKPALFGGSRRGTFELWHQQCRLTPLCGKSVHRVPGGTGGVTNKLRVLLASADTRPIMIPDGGYDLLHCMRHIPGLEQYLHDMGARPSFARCNLDINVELDTGATWNLVFHPAPTEVLDALYDRVKFEPASALTETLFPSGGRGYLFQDVLNDGKPSGAISLPNGVTFSEYTYLWPYTDEETALPYFGWLYLAAFILGTYARYYPDKWMRDIEEASYLAVTADALYRITADHAPLAALSQLSRTMWVSR